LYLYEEQERDAIAGRGRALGFGRSIAGGCLRHSLAAAFLPLAKFRWKRILGSFAWSSTPHAKSVRSTVPPTVPQPRGKASNSTRVRPTADVELELPFGRGT